MDLLEILRNRRLEREERLSQLAKFKKRFNAHAKEFDKKIEESNKFRDYKFEKSFDAFILAVEAVKAIIDDYQAHKFLFDKGAVRRIDKLILYSDKRNNMDSLREVINDRVKNQHKHPLDILCNATKIINVEVIATLNKYRYKYEKLDDKN